MRPRDHDRHKLGTANWLRASVLGAPLDPTTVRLGSGVAAVGDEVVLLGGGPGGIALPELAAWSGRTALDTLVVLGREAT